MSLGATLGGGQRGWPPPAAHPVIDFVRGMKFRMVRVAVGMGIHDLFPPQRFVLMAKGEGQDKGRVTRTTIAVWHPDAGEDVATGECHLARRYSHLDLPDVADCRRKKVKEPPGFLLTSTDLVKRHIRPYRIPMQFSHCDEGNRSELVLCVQILKET